MSGGRKSRSVANALETVITTPSERLLKESHSLYVDNENGLVKIAACLGLRLLPPRKKIIVMIMGNHSAGKSSFINWYVEEHIQKTGVAIETQGFTFITSGRKRESLTGNATLHLYPHFRPLLEFKGIMDYLSAEISTSKQKKFSLVTFMDTPGLVDGDMVYPFDVNSAITSFGEQADLIFVFFDPMGQALCKRTLDIVEKLSDKCGDKLHFCLSKADEAGKETDRQRVMMQIVQELCRRPGLNKCGFEMPTIYIPNPQKPSRCVNQINEVCEAIEKSINQAVQKSLDQLDKDCDLITTSISNKLAQDRAEISYNKSSRFNSFLCGVLAVFLPTLFILSFLIDTFFPEDLNTLVGEEFATALYFFMRIVLYLWQWIPEDGQFVSVIIFGAMCYFFFVLSRYFARQRSKTLTKKEKKKLIEYIEYVQDVIKAKKVRLGSRYQPLISR
uniref:Dynamin N-terminal domain-containing protein n=1 Tax=Electrophorus electricus TaxID=8005 RepID=A0A4W4F6H9_ELEEL